MGYRPPRKVYRVVGSGPYEGLEAKLAGVNLGRYLDLVSVADGMEGEDAPDEIGDMLAALDGALLEWNIEDDDGAPVPVGLDGLRTQDFDLVLWLFDAWLEAMGGTPDPLGGKPSASVTSDDEASIRDFLASLDRASTAQGPTPAPSPESISS